MGFDPADVRRIAHLSRLELSDADLARYAGQIDAILHHIEKLKAVDVEGVEPFLQPGGLSSVTRPDEVRPSLPAEEALKNAPARLGTYFVVPRVLDQA